MSSKIERIQTNSAPAPAGHYSQAVVHGGLVFVAGQLPIVPETGEKLTGPIEEQTRQVLKNVSAILEASGSSLDRVLKVTVYIPDMELWGSVNKVYAEIFGDHKPARAVVPTRELSGGFLIEVEAIAAVGDRG
jgi:2-iminobutanoate/2-iminopropanoate deaminase